MNKEKWKKVLWALLFPHKFLIFLLVNISAALLIYAFVDKNCPATVAYISYGLSAYALTVVCARMPEVFKKTKQGIYKNKYANKYLTEKELRIRISLYGGLVLNICFAIFKVVMGALYQSKWLFAMAGYNVILTVMRFVLVYRDQTDNLVRNKVDKQVTKQTNKPVKPMKTDYEKRMWGLHSYKVCGWLMLLLNIAISVIVVIVVFDNQRITYPGFMIYAIAAYTFYCLTMAIISMVKYWSRSNPVFSAVKRIGMAKALVSIFTLQVAMITQFGSGEGMNSMSTQLAAGEGMSSMSTQLANGATGFAVCAMINVMAILMLVGVKKDYKEIGGTNGK